MKKAKSLVIILMCAIVLATLVGCGGTGIIKTENWDDMQMTIGGKKITFPSTYSDMQECFVISDTDTKIPAHSFECISVYPVGTSQEEWVECHVYVYNPFDEMVEDIKDCYVFGFYGNLDVVTYKTQMDISLPCGISYGTYIEDTEEVYGNRTTGEDILERDDYKWTFETDTKKLAVGTESTYMVINCIEYKVDLESCDFYVE